MPNKTTSKLSKKFKELNVGFGFYDETVVKMNLRRIHDYFFDEILQSDVVGS